MQARLSLITLGVHDLKQATHFYQEGLGLPYSEHTNDNISFFELQGCWLALFPKNALLQDIGLDTSTASTGFPGMTLAHNVKTTTEVDTLLQQAVAAGGKLVKPAQATSWGGYSGYFTDLDGYYWEIAHNPFVWIE